MTWVRRDAASGDDLGCACDVVMLSLREHVPGSQSPWGGSAARQMRKWTQSWCMMRLGCTLPGCGASCMRPAGRHACAPRRSSGGVHNARALMDVLIGADDREINMSEEQPAESDRARANA